MLTRRYHILKQNQSICKIEKLILGVFFQHNQKKIRNFQTKNQHIDKIILFLYIYGHETHFIFYPFLYFNISH